MPKILVAEDDQFLANAYRVKLTKAGFELAVARDGAEVFTVLKKFHPDLILLDLVMPVKDGFTVLAELKADPDYRLIPVLVTSNLGQKEDRDKAHHLGAADYIIKSDVSLEGIIDKINQLLKVNRTTPAKSL